uniref:tudor domain-containing protein 15 n=1 Tax=Doryrhamphus excisus TaxID=161450 RepID=UPI0025AEB4E1|nr:tudor domain-containing protein 15 [Doryrhamphus excisus]XP_057920212.1 tudor domain-containing protein 15 [Doryrhamphus excisus]XP_057920219.1 tudor domain-containing protein 15 [Doryrhamphus excisus]XP_057920228.1 tudor domain-containing protein 15 [Doryrhamphus excisus]
MQSVLNSELHKCQDSSQCRVDLKLSHLDWNPEATLIYFQGQYLTIYELDYHILQQEIENTPKINAEVDIGKFCLVEDPNTARWYRGRVEGCKDGVFDVFLIDQGNVMSVDAAHMSACSDDFLTLPPKIVCGFLANVLALHSYSDRGVVKYLSSLIGRNITGYVQALLPHQVLLLEVPDVNNELVKHGFGKHMDRDTFLLLVELLIEAPLKQNIDEFSRQELCYKSSALQVYEQMLSFCGPRMACGSRAEVRVTAAVSSGLFYCQVACMGTYLRDVSKKLAAVCENGNKGDRQKNQENLGLLCSVKSKNGKWYRGFVQLLAVSSLARVFFIDYGFSESVQLHNVQKLPPDFYSIPIMAFPCSLSALAAMKEEVKGKQLGFLKEGLLGKLLEVKIDSFDEEHHLYFITVVASAQIVTNDPGQRLPPIKAESCLAAEKVGPQAFPCFYKTVIGRELVKTLKEEELQLDSAFEGYLELALSPSNFWIRTQKRNNEFQEMMKKILEHFRHVALDEDILLNPEPGTLCCALYEADMHFYRAVVTDRLQHGAQVLFIDFGNTERVPYGLIKKIPQTFASISAFALCCTLVNVIPLDDVWTCSNSDFFREAISNKALLIRLVHITQHKCVVELHEMGGGNSRSISELLVSAKQAEYWRNIPVEPVVEINTRAQQNISNEPPEQSLATEDNFQESFIYSSFGLTSNSEVHVHVTHVSSKWDIYCQLERNTEVLNDLEVKISEEREKVKHVGMEDVAKKVCLAKYLDGKWYRGLVHSSLSPLHFSVFFVDYGNSCISEKSHVVSIPTDCEHLLSTPVQALRFNLIGVSRKVFFMEVKKWLDGAVLNKQLRAVIVRSCDDASFDVELFDGDLNINGKVTELINSLSSDPKSVLTFSQTYANKDHKERGSTLVKWKNFPKKKAYSYWMFNKQRGFNAKMASQRRKDHVDVSAKKHKTKHQTAKTTATRSTYLAKPQKDPEAPQVQNQTPRSDDETEALRANVRPQLSCLPKRKEVAGSSMTCFATHVNSVKDFFLQLSDDEAAILKLVEEMNSNLLSLRAALSVRIADLVLARYDEDGSVYRAVVTAREGNSRFKVDFLDYGNSGVVEKEKIFRFSQEFLSQPPFSIRCSLRDSSLYHSDASFTDAIMEIPLRVHFVQKHERHWEVDVEVLNQAESWMKVDAHTAHSSYHEAKVKCDITETSSPQTLAFAPVSLDKEYSGFAAAVTTPSDFCVVLKDSLPLMNQVTIMLEELSEEPPLLPKRSLMPGNSCLFQFDLNTKWCLAEIVQVDPSVVLNLVDYGLRVHVPYEDCISLRSLPDALMNLRKRVYPCCLRGVTPAGGDCQWSQEGSVYFQECLDQNFYVVFREGLSNWVVDILVDGVHVAKRLVDAGLAKYTDAGLAKYTDAGLAKDRDAGLAKGTDAGLAKGTDAGLAKGTDAGYRFPGPISSSPQSPSMQEEDSLEVSEQDSAGGSDGAKTPPSEEVSSSQCVLM